MLILYKNARNVRFVLFTKTSNNDIYANPDYVHRVILNGGVYVKMGTVVVFFQKPYISVCF